MFGYILAWIAGAAFGFVWGVLWKEHHTKTEPSNK